MSGKLTFVEWKTLMLMDNWPERSDLKWQAAYDIYLRANTFVYDATAKRKYEEEVARIKAQETKRVQEQIAKGAQTDQAKRVREAVEHEKEEQEKTRVYLMEHPYKEIGGGKYECLAETVELVYAKCYWEWWSEDVRNQLMDQWMKRNPFSNTEMFKRLNANSGQPWRAINSFLGKAPLNPKREESVELDYYYGTQVPWAGTLYEWSLKHLDRWGDHQQSQVRRMFNEAGADAVMMKIQARNALENVSAGADEVVKGAEGAGNYFYDKAAKALPTSNTMYMLYAAAMVALLAVTAGGTAYVVHELK